MPQLKLIKPINRKIKTCCICNKIINDNIYIHNKSIQCIIYYTIPSS